MTELPRPAAPAALLPGPRYGLNNTFQNAGQVVSTGLFFTLMTVGLAGSLPAGLYQGLVAHGVPSAAALHRGGGASVAARL